MFENFTVVRELSKFDFTFHSLQWGFSKLTATDYFHRYTQYRSVQSAGPKFGFWECRIQYSWPNMVGLCSTGQLERLRAGFPQKMFCSPCRGALFLPKTVHPCKGRKKIFCSPPAGVHCFCPRQCTPAGGAKRCFAPPLQGCTVSAQDSADWWPQANYHPLRRDGQGSGTWGQVCLVHIKLLQGFSIVVNHADSCTL